MDGAPAHILRSDGAVVELAVARWHDAATVEDGWLLDRCTGPVVDLGCGPGRLVAALVARGVPVLGVDQSAAAQRQCRRRRAPMVRRDLFSRLPAEGCWDHVLLADGNIGIGGDPVRLLRRAARLLAPGGTVLVETDPRPDLLWSGTARIRTSAGTGRPVPWACVGADALAGLAGAAGLVRTARHEGPRSFAELGAAPPAGRPPGRRTAGRPT
ncbi:methyltransferase domain-containing protein [Pseudonocardia sp. S2-4]|uniref:Methyltransferase domain-containing protein n=1 Tax=Pseudonocardia humida TaxID=2800819 RepID=A0ABT1ACC6_9PSEU|nr:methyltransferase domain-containing protein [Pseudonocardia humida]